ncbi:MAG: hypothetical protein QM650_03480, partial [Microlunatus sp.]
MTTSAHGLSGILAGVRRLETWLHLTLVLLTVGSAIRYLQGHGFGDRAPAVLTGAALLLVVYAAYRRVPWRQRRWWLGHPRPGPRRAERRPDRRPLARGAAGGESSSHPAHRRSGDRDG